VSLTTLSATSGGQATSDVTPFAEQINDLIICKKIGIVYFVIQHKQGDRERERKREIDRING
jgi:hypothetical protein